jgi:AcrR family transcriptional regulator
MEAATARIDGRTARALRTREAVVDALIAILEDGNPQPSVEEIAERAGVSARSVFGHFGDRESLFSAVAERRAEKLRAEWERLPDPAAPLAQRIAALAGQRARLYEQIAPIRRGALIMEPGSETIRTGLEGFRALKRREAVKLFHTEIAGDKALAAALGAVASFSTWDELRRRQGLSVECAEAALRRAVEGLFSGA